MTTEHEAKGGTLPKVLANAVAKHGHKLAVDRNGSLAVDHDSGFATPTGLAWDILLAKGWTTGNTDGGHRVIIESRAKDAAELLRDATECYCDDCTRKPIPMAIQTELEL